MTNPIHKVMISVHQVDVAVEHPDFKAAQRKSPKMKKGKSLTTTIVYTRHGYWPLPNIFSNLLYFDDWDI